MASKEKAKVLLIGGGEINEWSHFAHLELLPPFLHHISLRLLENRGLVSPHKAVEGEWIRIGSSESNATRVYALISA